MTEAGVRDVDATDFDVFVLIDQGLTQAEIAEVIGVSPQAVNKRFRRYLDRGWIKKSIPQTEDRRYVNLSSEKVYVITDKGRELVFKGFHRELCDELNHCIHAIRHYLDVLEAHLNRPREK